MFSHILDVASQLRPCGEFPATLVPISSDGCDITLYLDTAQMGTDDECPVIARGPGLDDVIIADSFLGFVRSAKNGDPLAAL